MRSPKSLAQDFDTEHNWRSFDGLRLDTTTAIEQRLRSMRGDMYAHYTPYAYTHRTWGTVDSNGELERKIRKSE